MKYAYIVKTPGTCRGKPRIDGTRIKVEMIAEWIAHRGQTPQEVQSSHPRLTLAQIHSALAYYYDHRQEIDASINQGHELAEKMQKQFPSALQTKIKSKEHAEP